VPKKPTQPKVEPQAAAVEAKPLHIVSLKQWRQDSGLQVKLRRLIDDPVFQLAEQTLIRAAFPGVEPQAVAVPGTTADAMNTALAQKYCHRSGFYYFVRMLRFLCAPQGSAIPETPYAGLLPEDE
jgi:hypothetical protein